MFFIALPFSEAIYFIFMVLTSIYFLVGTIGNLHTSGELANTSAAMSVTAMDKTIEASIVVCNQSSISWADANTILKVNNHLVHQLLSDSECIIILNPKIQVFFSIALPECASHAFSNRGPPAILS